MRRANQTELDQAGNGAGDTPSKKGLGFRHKSAQICCIMLQKDGARSYMVLHIKILIKDTIAGLGLVKILSSILLR